MQWLCLALGSGRAIFIEGVMADTINFYRTSDEYDGSGKNMLGQILMRVRQELRS